MEYYDFDHVRIIIDSSICQPVKFTVMFINSALPLSPFNAFVVEQGTWEFQKCNNWFILSYCNGGLIAGYRKHGLFYITFSCLNWTRLFELTHSFDVVYKWLDYLKSKGHFINGYPDNYRDHDQSSSARINCYEKCYPSC